MQMNETSVIATYHGVKEFQNSLNITIDIRKTKSGAKISSSNTLKYWLWVINDVYF